MSSLDPLPDFPPITDEPAPDDDSGRYYHEELSLAFRNRGMPLEALRYRAHADRAALPPDPFRHPGRGGEADWRLDIGGLVDQPITLDLDAIKPCPQSPARSPWNAPAMAARECIRAR